MFETADDLGAYKIQVFTIFMLNSYENQNPVNPHEAIV